MQCRQESGVHCQDGRLGGSGCGRISKDGVVRQTILWEIGDDAMHFHLFHRSCTHFCCGARMRDYTGASLEETLRLAQKMWRCTGKAEICKCSLWRTGRD